MNLAITGMGLVTALGDSVDSVWAALCAGRRGLGPVTLFDSEGHRAHLAGQVDLGGDSARVGWSRSDRLAWHACKQALDQAGFAGGLGDRCGLVVGGSTAGMFETEALLADMAVDPTKRVPHPAMLAHPLSATVDRLCDEFGLFCRTRTLCTACSSGANAIALGAMWIEQGLCDRVLAGGTDGLCKLTFAGFGSLGTMDPDGARPFDRDRKGLTLGEGAGFFVLERASSAAARGAHWSVELVGWAAGSEAHHIANPEESGATAARVMVAAIERAGGRPHEVGYVNAHGTATVLNDTMESSAICRVFGDHRPAVSSIKGAIGHTLGAAGAIEAIVTALAVRDDLAPPNAGLHYVDDACAPIALVSGALVHTKIDLAVSNSFGFGGADAVVAIAKRGARTSIDPPNLGVPIYVQSVQSFSRAGFFAGAEQRALASSSRTDLTPSSWGQDRLDLARVRRIDPTSRMAIAASLAMPLQPADGVVVGRAFGEPDASANFLGKLREKGPRLVPPAEFPGLVPSALAGHLSIYHGLRGPSCTVADLSTSGEAAWLQAIEWIHSGYAPRVLAGSVEGVSAIAERCLSPVFADDRAPFAPARTFGVAWALLTTEPTGVRIADACAIEHAPGDRLDAIKALAHASPPSAVGVVGLESLRDELAAVTGRSSIAVEPAVGRHEGVGGFALVYAAGLVMAGEAACWVVASSRRRSYGFVIERAR
jgi:3-oxoacyl-[acyl-carrier-protein] synthase II